MVLSPNAGADDGASASRRYRLELVGRGSHKLRKQPSKPPGENVISMRMSELENWTKSGS